jgi:hypothetical protein
MNDGLADLVAAAIAAGPTKIEFRDRIAVFGVDAVEAMAPLLADVSVAAFAVRVVGQAAAYGGRSEAIAALVETAGRGPSPVIRQDAEQELRRLGGAKSLATGSNCEVLERGSLADGRPFVRFSVRAQGQNGHFTVDEGLVTSLGLRRDPDAYLEVTAREVLFRGVIGLRSRNEVYPRQREESTRPLEKIRPYERIEVLMAPPPPHDAK